MAKILIVDDRPTNRQFLVTLLAYVGLQAVDASDGRQPWDLRRAEHPQLIVTDLKMPRMDGIEFLRQMQEDAAFARTPVIVYTATYQAPEAEELTRGLDVRPFIMTKPSQPEIILQVVQQAL